MSARSATSLTVLGRRLMALLAVLALTAVTFAVPAGAEETTDPGTRPEGFTEPNTFSAASTSSSGMEMLVNERGRLSKSVDATAGGGVQVDKPAGATVRAAYLGVATTGFQQFRLPAGSVTLAGQPVPLANELSSGIYSYNYFADVTSIVKPVIDDAAAGVTTLAVAEAYPYQTEGEVLIVIFDDPAVTADKSVTILYGALNPAGDTYGLQLARAVDTTDPATQMEMSLGISFGSQGSTQYSTVHVNGQPLTSAAGGQDDGYSANGALITAGGIGDSLANPTDPTAYPYGYRSDDELYDLRPFVRSGDRAITVTTANPSNDDNVFLSVFEMNPPVIGVSVGVAPLEVTPSWQSLILGETASFTMEAIAGELDFTANFRVQVVSGPNTGMDYTYTCSGGCVFGGSGPTTFTLTSAPGAVPGVDLVEMWDDKNDNALRDADEPYGITQVEWFPAVHAVGMGDSYSSGEGAGSYDSGTDAPRLTFGGPVHNRCHRSEHAYARLSQPPLYSSSVHSYTGGVTDSRVDFIACSGATTVNVDEYGTGQYDNEPTQLSQGKLSYRTNLVTLSLGGNDIGFADIIKKCVFRRDCLRKGEVGGMPLTEWIDGRLAALPGKLEPILSDIRTKAPNATVVLMGYPKVFPASDGRGCPDLSLMFRGDAMDWANSLADRLDTTMASAAADAGVHFRSVQNAFSGHEICGPDGSWIIPLISPGIPDLFNLQVYSAESFHPNQDGQRYGYAATLNAFLRGGDIGTGLTDAGMPRNPEPRATLMSTMAAEEVSTAVSVDLGRLYTAPDPNAPETACAVGTPAESGVVPTGGKVWVAGSGFTPSASVEIALDASGPDEPAAKTTVATVAAAADGSLGHVIVMPVLPHGTYVELTATGETPRGRQELLAAVVAVDCASGGSEFTFEGFFAPVNNAPTVNTTKAGSAVPVKFSLGGDFGLDIFAEGSPSSVRVDCASGSSTDDIEQTVNPGESTLSYSPETGRYQYVWKTRDVWSDTCRRLDVTLRDGTTKSAYFAFR